MHPGTASRALNAGTRQLVNAETAARVIAAAEELGYSPNPIARGLKTSRSASVGVVIPDLTNPLFPPIVRGIEDVFREAGYSALIVNTDNDLERERSVIDALRQRNVDGFIIATSRLEHPLIEELAESSAPIVLLNRRMTRADIPTVTSDDPAGISLAVRHLYELGHRNLVHLAGPQNLSTGVARRRAFVQSLTELDLDAGEDRITVCDSWSDEVARQALSEMFESGPPFTAVVAGNDLIALGCYQAIADRGLRCPDDISVVGFNDIPFMDKVTPPLTTIRIPHYDIGAQAARLLLDVLHHPGAPARSLVLPVSLVLRASTGFSPRDGANKP